MDWYEKDIKKVVEAYRNRGYEITKDQADDIWREYSEELFAGWMTMGDNLDTIFEQTEQHARKLGII